MSKERMSAAEYRAMMGVGAQVQPSEKKPQIRLPVGQKMNKTEQRFQRWAESYWKGCKVDFGVLRFRLPSGTHYTPDFAVWGNYDLTCVEVKGGIRRTQNERSPHAFKEARAAFPHVRWVWAQWDGEEWRLTE